MTDIMKKAKEIVDGHALDRDKDKERSMKQIVKVFNALTGKDLTEHDGDIFMMCLKLVRMQRDPTNEDNYVDLAGYTQMAYEARNKIASETYDNFAINNYTLCSTCLGTGKQSDWASPCMACNGFGRIES